MSTERQGHHTLQLTQLLVRIFATMIVIQIKQARAFPNSSHQGFMVAAMKIYSGVLCFKFYSGHAEPVFFCLYNIQFTCGVFNLHASFFGVITSIIQLM